MSWLTPFLLVMSVVFWSSPAAAASRGLPAEVEAALDQAKLPRDALVAVVQEVGSTQLRVNWQAQKLVNPASLTKLLTTSAALDLLGPAWTWSTPVWLQGTLQNGDQKNGVLDGNLVIKGSGDPKLVLERLWLLLRRVQQLGVREIRGDIVLDRSAFGLPEQASGDFDGETLRPYNVSADALLLNYKSVVITFTPLPAKGVAMVSMDPPLQGVRTDISLPLSNAPCDDWRSALKADFSDPTRIKMAGSFSAACGEKQWAVAYADPKTYNERALSGMWREMGGKLSGVVRDGAAPANTAPTFEVQSPPLAEVVRDINKFSNNVMAQQLFLSLALVQRGQGTPDAARELMRQWLVDRLGDVARTAVIDNGSGLSREARVSAQMMARLLQVMWAGPTMPELLSSLPVTGVDGTLRRSKAPSGRAHLKTGSLRDVMGIAGVVLSHTGRRYVLVAIVNHPNAGAARTALDALVKWTVVDDTKADARADTRPDTKADTKPENSTTEQ
ncbi:MAG: D-alanyl-D-alanine carboxypeptidase/D-alanyl-D-alanine-endopeptidase [Pseudorhodobacter sp.]|nr:D-alanyl-D-alanine carboxypeptidase/D-alanyl-D-alanine-endopeptidase [Rhizobacter sp.]